MEAKVLGSDKGSDIALLKVEATGLKAVKLGDSNEFKSWAMGLSYWFAVWIIR